MGPRCHGAQRQWEKNPAKNIDYDVTIICNYYCCTSYVHQLCLGCVIWNHIVIVEITTRGVSGLISGDTRYRLSRGGAFIKFSLGTRVVSNPPLARNDSKQGIVVSRTR